MKNFGWHALVIAIGLVSTACTGGTSPDVVDGSTVDTPAADMGTLPCSTIQTRCGDRCVDTQNDRTNCGSCGNTCPAGNVCASGTCALECGMYTTLCHTRVATDAGTSSSVPFCANTMSDNENCGACGHACAPGQICVAGACQAACPAGQTACGSVCVTLATDSMNCGMCGTTCPAGHSCMAGTCAPNCSTSQMMCGGACVDTNSDSDHCGDCTTVCAPGSRCAGGVCTVTCSSAQTDCAGICVNTQTDEANCGGCGTPCAAGQICVSGACQTACPSGLSACGANCVDLTGDVANCGACGTTCTAPNGVAACSASTCGIASCTGSFGNCDAMAANGCETDLQNDTNNCGMCGHVCPAGIPCNAGTCVGYVTVAPVTIASPASCSTAIAMAGHKAAVDGLGNLWASMSCGGSLYIAASMTFGRTWQAAANTGIVNVSDFALAGLAGRGVLIAATRSDGAIVVTTSMDGTTFATPVVLPATTALNGPGWNVTAAVHGTTWLVAWPTAGSTTNFGVARSSTGLGGFAVGTATSPMQFNYAAELGWDAGAWYLLYERNPPLQAGVLRSADDGLTWGLVSINVASPHGFSDFAIGGGTAFFTGTGNTVEHGAIATIATTPPVATMLASNSSAGGRSISADGSGVAYIVTEGSPIALQRSTETTQRSLEMGTAPAVATLPTNNGALVVYTQGTQIRATVQTY